MRYNFEVINIETLKRAFKLKNLLPYKVVDGKKDIRWNEKIIGSKVIQGIMSGESIPKIAKSFRGVLDMNRASAVRNARTSITACENIGRLNALKKARKDGIKLRKQWMATHDGRTRDSHIEIDGETVLINEEFSNGCMEPGDPAGEPEEVYNCRCTMVGVVDGIDPSIFNERAYER